MTLRALLLAVGLLSSGLMAGLLYGWKVSVIPGASRTDGSTYVATMQHINVAILNPSFLVPFLGTPFVLAAAAVANHRAGETRRALAIGSAAAVYLVGVLGVTVGGNVPLNDQLDRFSLTGAADGSIASMRAAYEGPWNRWHTVRTGASIVAFGLLAATLALEEETA